MVDRCAPQESAYYDLMADAFFTRRPVPLRPGRRRPRAAGFGLAEGAALSGAAFLYNVLLAACVAGLAVLTLAVHCCHPWWARPRRAIGLGELGADPRRRLLGRGRLPAEPALDAAELYCGITGRLR
ncbi:hypothetical protein C7M71_029835 [Peterkaempfera bronchialis]|uniref:Uncharacterized protein n=1 Tax=Peterkaempfera bronchialis TaxID=2126346 RepID=A0A345T4Q5_9ACTN|nr:hypothetical protein C7M71_029835 [Peterkaempfera bronchialis]